MNVIECLAGSLEQAQETLRMLTGDLRKTECEHVPCAGASNVRWIMEDLTETDRGLLARLGAAAPGEEASFEEVSAKLIEAVGVMDSFDLDRQVDDSALAKTLGSLLSLTALPTALHAGQISTIRRSLGYSSVF